MFKLEIIFTILAVAMGACLGRVYGHCIKNYVHNGRFGNPFRLKPIPRLSPFIELVSAASALLLALRFGPSLPFATLVVITGCLIVASGIDLFTYILPDSLTLPLAIIGIPVGVLVLNLYWLDSLLGGVGGAALLYGLRLAFHHWRSVEALGLGDIKLMLGLGFLCGFSGLSVLLLVASIAGLAIVLVWTKCVEGPQSLRDTPIPFGPLLRAYP